VNASTAVSPHGIGPARALKPAGWGESLVLFGVPAAGLAAAYYLLRPWLERNGVPAITAFVGSLSIPLVLMFASALIAYRLEGHPLTWSAFSERMRFPKPRGKDVLIGLGLFAATVAGYALFSIAATALVKHGILPLPANRSIMDDPNTGFSWALFDRAAGGRLHGQWPIALLFLVAYFFNVAGEELWWRGYVLPRQELVFGRHTWIVHGLLWAGFHAYKYWEVLALVPVCLLIAFAAQRLRNNWPGTMVHFLMNLSGPVVVLIGVLRPSS
jgi:membrane protease YdiL (CAAX protease family)